MLSKIAKSALAKHKPDNAVRVKGASGSLRPLGAQPRLRSQFNMGSVSPSPVVPSVVRTKKIQVTDDDGFVSTVKVPLTVKHKVKAVKPPLVVVNRPVKVVSSKASYRPDTSYFSVGPTGYSYIMPAGVSTATIPHKDHFSDSGGYVLVPNVQDVPVGTPGALKTRLRTNNGPSTSSRPASYRFMLTGSRAKFDTPVVKLGMNRGINPNQLPNLGTKPARRTKVKLPVVRRRSWQRVPVQFEFPKHSYLNDPNYVRNNVHQFTSLDYKWGNIPDSSKTRSGGGGSRKPIRLTNKRSYRSTITSRVKDFSIQTAKPKVDYSRLLLELRKRMTPFQRKHYVINSSDANGKKWVSIFRALRANSKSDVLTDALAAWDLVLHRQPPAARPVQSLAALAYQNSDSSSDDDDLVEKPSVVLCVNLPSSFDRPFVNALDFLPDPPGESWKHSPVAVARVRRSRWTRLATLPPGSIYLFPSKVKYAPSHVDFTVAFALITPEEIKTYQGKELLEYCKKHGYPVFSDLHGHQLISNNGLNSF